jgi:serine/threonine-protein kinase
VQLLGKYEIISEIGRGAMGAVYKARDPLIDRLVALKTITGGPSAQTNLLDRFYQEARSAGALQHPNIVTIYELGHEKNTPFIAMEYLEGESLDRIIEQHPVLPLSVKLGYIVRVCDALAYAHQHNVVHRDVKPANVMVTKEGVVKVVDFGIDGHVHDAAEHDDRLPRVHVAAIVQRRASRRTLGHLGHWRDAV